ncbi:MAG: cysteine hydrolase family protein [Acidimicrobiales bacterium]
MDDIDLTVWHPSGIDQAIVDKVVGRRGRLHAFESLDPTRTALVVIDMNTGSVEQEMQCTRIVEPVNAMADALRRAGGCVAWVTSEIDQSRAAQLTKIAGARRAARFVESARLGSPGAAMWPGLDVHDHDDVFASKRGTSAFFPGSCSLSRQLDARDITSILIAGTVTNVCCESSARDATELGYEVTMVSDACHGHSHGLHEASLATFFRIFGDVRPSREVLDLIAAAARPTASASSSPS